MFSTASNVRSTGWHLSADTVTARSSAMVWRQMADSSAACTVRCPRVPKAWSTTCEGGVVPGPKILPVPHPGDIQRRGFGLRRRACKIQRRHAHMPCATVSSEPDRHSTAKSSRRLPPPMIGRTRSAIGCIDLRLPSSIPMMHRHPAVAIRSLRAGDENTSPTQSYLEKCPFSACSIKRMNCSVRIWMSVSWSPASK